MLNSYTVHYNVQSKAETETNKHNGQKKKYKRINIDLQNIHIKLKIE